MIPSKQYRAEIDGLRALAVMAVVFFHAFPSLVCGGFIGVDIFFVISGFLITSHIFESQNNKNFSFIVFYSRRIRRLFPALLLVLTTCLIAGWLFLLSQEYKQLGKHIAASSMFIINFVLEEESGYFDTAAELKPLLHLWSLAIEEQYYLVWPIVLFLAWKYKKNVLTFICLFWLLSFGLNLIFFESKPDKVFFWPYGRFWELMTGSLLAWITVYKQRTVNNQLVKIEKSLCNRFFKTYDDYSGKFIFNIFSLLGLTLFLLGISNLNSSSVFPSGWALIPVIGTVLIIISGSGSWINRILLMNPVSIWFGLISYPLYLWHWPIFSFISIIIGETSHKLRIGAILISIILAWLTYKFIETPIRKRAVSKKITFVLGFSIIVIGAIGLGIETNNGIRDRAIDKFSSITARNTNLGAMSEMDNECEVEEKIKNKIDVCLSDIRMPIRYALIGDSKAKSLAPGLVRTSDETGRWLIIAGNNSYGSPSPFLSSQPRFKRYQSQLTNAIKAINTNDNIEYVTMIPTARIFTGNSSQDTNWSRALDAKDQDYEIGKNALRNTIEAFLEANKKILLVVDNPGLGKREQCGERVTKIPLLGIISLNASTENCSIKLKDYDSHRARYIEALLSVAREYEGEVKVFETREIFCDVTNQICTRTKDGYNVLAYTDHMSDHMSGLVGEKINKFLKNWAIGQEM